MCKLSHVMFSDAVIFSQNVTGIYVRVLGVAKKRSREKKRNLTIK